MEKIGGVCICSTAIFERLQPKEKEKIGKNRHWITWGSIILEKAWNGQALIWAIGKDQPELIHSY